MENWKKNKLIKLAKFINGYAFKPDHWTMDGLPIVRIEQLKKPDSKYDYCSHNIPKNNLIDSGDLIFSWSASLFLKIWDRGEAALNQHLFKVIQNDDIDKFFLKYLIEFNLEELIKTAHGSTMQHITRKELERFDVNIPTSKSEQTRIAQILSKADEAIAQTEALIAKYQRIKTGLMQDLLTRGIDEKGNIRSKATHQFVVKNGMEVPVEWEVLQLGEISKKITSGSRGWAEFYSTEGSMFIRIGNLTRENLNFRFEDIKRVKLPNNEEGSRTRLQEGDILISITADLGIIGVIPNQFEEAYINQHIALVRIEDEKINSRFIGYILQSELGEKQFKSTNESGAKAGMNLPTIAKLIIIKPSKNEQDKIVSLIDKQVEFITMHKQNLTKLHSLKKGLMQDLLSGKVKVV